MDFDKVDFLDDRREHDKHTSERFKAYAEYEAVTVDDTSSTYELRREMLSKESGIIVTTTFKLNNFVKELIDGQDDRLKEKRIVFIIDEAHRTTMGVMMVTSKSYFRKNGIFYGFTGKTIYD